MSKEVAKKESTELSADLVSWDFDGVDSRDIIIPRLLLLQSNSTLVSDGKGQAGDIIDTSTYSVRASGQEKTKKDIELIPFKMFKSILVERVVGQEKEFVSNNMLMPGDEIPPYERPQADGSILRSGTCYNVFFLDVSKIEDPSSLPYIVTFKGGSRMTGQKIGDYFNQCMRAAMAGIRDHRALPPGHVFKIGAIKTKNDEGRTYFAFEQTKDRMSSLEEIKAAKLWLDSMKTKNVVVKEDETAPF